MSSLLPRGLRVHVDWFAVFRHGFRFMPTWDVMERAFASGVVLARAHSAGVGRHGISSTIEGVGLVAEEVKPSSVNVAN